LKGNDQVIAKLNDLLADELTAINQYMVHSELCANYGYDRLHEAIEKRAIVEMKHAEKLIARIVFLDGQPVVSNLKPIHIATEVQAMHNNDLGAELGAVTTYNDGIRVAVDAADAGTRELLEDILEDEEEHVDWLEAQLAQISQMGIQVYLQAQVDKD
jgi:bacterioferritin